MRYLVLTASDPAEWERASPEARAGYGEAHGAFERAVAARGTVVTAAALAAADTATTLRHGEAGLTVTDGPFVELTEQIGGVYLVELPDLDAAVEAAGLLPATYAVEIRPTMDLGGHGLP